jgi:transposase
MMVSTKLLVDTMVEPRLGEMVRRRFWAESAKRRMVAETLAPGASVSIVARRHDVNANLLFKWKRDLAPSDNGAVDLAEPACELVPIGVLGTGSTGTPALAWSSRSGVMEIELVTGVRIRVDSTVDERALGRALQVLKCCG